MSTESAVAILHTAGDEYRVKKTTFVGNITSGWNRNKFLIDEVFCDCPVIRSEAEAKSAALQERSTLGTIMIDFSDSYYSDLIEVVALHPDLFDQNVVVDEREDAKLFIL